MVTWCWKIMSVPLMNDEQKQDDKDNLELMDKAHYCQGQTVL